MASSPSSGRRTILHVGSSAFCASSNCCRRRLPCWTTPRYHRIWSVTTTRCGHGPHANGLHHQATSGACRVQFRRRDNSRERDVPPPRRPQSPGPVPERRPGRSGTGTCRYIRLPPSDLCRPHHHSAYSRCERDRETAPPRARSPTLTRPGAHVKPRLTSLPGQMDRGPVRAPARPAEYSGPEEEQEGRSGPHAGRMRQGSARRFWNGGR